MRTSLLCSKCFTTSCPDPIHVKSISTAQTPKYSGRKSLEDSKSAILFYYLYKIQSIKQLWSLHRSMSEAASDGPSLVLKSTATLYLFRLQLEKYAATSESSKRGEGNSQKVYSFNPKLFYRLSFRESSWKIKPMRVFGWNLISCNTQISCASLGPFCRNGGAYPRQGKLVRFQILSCWLYPSSKKLKK